MRPKKSPWLAEQLLRFLAQDLAQQLTVFQGLDHWGNSIWGFQGKRKTLTIPGSQKVAKQLTDIHKGQLLAEHAS